MITDDNYYIAINILDRINQEIEEKGLSKTELCQRIGIYKSWFNVALCNARVLRFNTLKKTAKALNISLEYLITGKNKETYKHCFLNKDKLFSLKGKNIPNRLIVTLSKLKNNKIKDISIKTLLDVSYYYKIDIINFIGRYNMYFSEYVKIHKKIFPLATSDIQLKKFCEEYNEFDKAEETKNFMEEWGDSLFVAISLQRFEETQNLAELLIDNLYFRYDDKMKVKIHKYLDKAVKKVESREYKFVNGEYVREK